MTADGESLWRGGTVEAVRRDWLGVSILLAVVAHVLAWLVGRILPAILAILGMEAATVAWLLPLVPPVSPPPPPPQEMAFVLIDTDDDRLAPETADALSTVNREATQTLQPDREDVSDRPNVESESDILFARTGMDPIAPLEEPSAPMVDPTPPEEQVDAADQPPEEAPRPEVDPAPSQETPPVESPPSNDVPPLPEDNGIAEPSPVEPPVSPPEPQATPEIPRPPPPEPVTIRQIGANAQPTPGMPPPRLSGSSRFGDDISMRLLKHRWGWYYDEMVRKLEQSLRRQEVLNPTPTRRGEVVLRFGIAADGSVVDLVVLHAPEGMVVERGICERTVREAGPFPPLTPEMQKDENFRRLTLRVIFL